MNTLDTMKTIFNNSVLVMLSVPGIVLILIGIVSIFTGIFELSVGSFLLGIIFIFLGGGWIITMIDKIKK